MKARAPRRPAGAPRVAAPPPGPSSAERDRINKAFLAMALCHELKQPLHSLNLNVELLTKRIARITNSETHPPEIDSSLLALGRVVDRVNECLNAFAARAAPEVTRPTTIDLREVLNGVGARARAAAPGIRIAVSVGELPSLHVHADQLAVALDAVLANAIKASEAAHTGDVLLSARRAEDEIRIEVVDKGIGMSPDVLRHAFEIGYSTWGGDGTGLTIAKFIAYHHSGGFGMTSQPGQGTTVSMVVPILDQDEE